MLVLALALLFVVSSTAQDLTGYTVADLPPQFFLNNPNLQINPQLNELA